MKAIEDRKLNNELRRETEKARVISMEKQCQEVEKLEKEGRTNLMYQKVKEMSHKKGNIILKIEIEDINGNKLKRPEDVVNRWIEYVEKL